METLALGIAGFVAPFVTNLIKDRFGWSGHGAMLLTLVISGIIAVVAVMASGGELSWSDPTMVFGITTVVYQFLIKNEK